MPNKKIVNKGVPELWIDNGDGTFSKKFVAHDPSIGETNAAAIITDSNGTVTGFLRGLVKMISNVWNSDRSAINVRLIDEADNTIFPDGEWIASYDETAPLRSKLNGIHNDIYMMKEFIRKQIEPITSLLISSDTEYDSDPAYTFTAITDCVIASITLASPTSAIGAAALDGATIKAGTTLLISFTQIELTSGVGLIYTNY